ncbi:hypothetical protein WH367_19425 [Comamonas sp. MYb21]|uniref:hypothetical protein n=1 Tax=Comamonas sp. MYb21 TaxID=1848648 RepID=UPI0030B4F452
MPTPVPPIDPQLPPFPGPNTPESAYDDMAFDWGTAVPGHGNRIAAIGQNVYDNAVEALQSAEDAADSAQDAADQLALVQTAANGAFAAANYKGDWAGLTGALAVPATVTHLGRLWYLKSNLANVASQTPALGSTYWGEVSRNDFTVLPCPAGTTIAADRGMYRMSSGSSVLQLPASPFHGMVVAAVNMSGTLTPVIQRNGKTICGDAEDYVMNVLNWQIMLQFDSATNDWVRISGVTAYTAANPAIASANNWTAAQNFNAGASFGDGKVLLRKTITVIAPVSNAGSSIISASNHGLNYSKIRGVSVLAVGATFSTPPEYGAGTNIRFSAYIDAAACVVVLSANQGQDLSNRPVYFTIEYEP